MAMLAERKRKVKWALNPRGKLWSDDSSKFGQKILEKMGWSSGKGLGVDESGITEHIKVSFKNDSQGIGYKDRGDQWTEHEDQFNSLLSSLNGVAEKVEESEEPIACTGFGFKQDEDEKPTPTVKELSGESLEEKSKKSRARVHYKKFTRGKDISQYSEKDLANIFGKKVKDEPLTEAPKVPVLKYGIIQPPNQLKSTEKVKEEKDPNFGITTIESKLSMADYFKSKMPSLGKSKKYTVGPNGVLVSVKAEEDDKQEDNYRASFQQYNIMEENPKQEEEFDNECVSFNVDKVNDIKSTDLDESEQLYITKQKKSKKSDLKELYKEKSNGIENDVEYQENDVASEQKISKNKKKKSKKRDIASDKLQSNDTENENYSENNKDDSEDTKQENSFETEQNISKKKKKKQCSTEDELQLNDIEIENYSEKSKDNKNYSENNISEETTQENNFETVQNMSKKKKKKAKKEHTAEDELHVNDIENEIFSEQSTNNKNYSENNITEDTKQENNFETEQHLSKKKKKKAKKENTAEDELQVYDIENENDSKKHHEKNKSSLNNVPSEQLIKNIETSKIKKSAKSKIIQNVECNDSNEDMKLSKVSKTKRKYEVIHENIEAETEIANNDCKLVNNLATPEPKKKKRKNDKSAEIVQEANDSFYEKNIEITEESVKSEIKKKNKRKRKQKNDSNKEKNNPQGNIEVAEAKKNKDSLENEMTKGFSERSNRKNAKKPNDRRNGKPTNPQNNIKGKILKEFCEKGNEILLQGAFSGSNFLKLSGYGKIKSEADPTAT